MKAHKPLTRELLVSAFIYDPETGSFTNRIHRRSARAGQPAGGPRGKGYSRIQVYGRAYSVHRLAWLYVYGEPVPRILDHINGDRGDNRIANLRPATPLQNTGNRKRPSNNSVGLKGVSRKGRRFAAIITIDGKQVWLGTFSTAEEAASVYADAAAARFGEYCNYD